MDKKFTTPTHHTYLLHYCSTSLQCHMLFNQNVSSFQNVIACNVMSCNSKDGGLKIFSSTQHSIYWPYTHLLLITTLSGIPKSIDRILIIITFASKQPIHARGFNSHVLQHKSRKGKTMMKLLILVLLMCGNIQLNPAP